MQTRQVASSAGDTVCADHGLSEGRIGTGMSRRNAENLPVGGAASETLLFWVNESDAAAEDDSMALFGRGSEPALRRVPLGALRTNLAETVDALQDLFGRIADRGGPMPLKQAQVTFQVSASGGIQLVGSSQVQGTHGITFVFGG
ncbi:hypothetical protein [Kitasatospora sp. NPDC057198]|uniref:Pepco domain-containing protein n=1 Tax=Kitasatospora sp. NPDC057198 TaxID=3346046 RepID=UPI0036380CF5